MRFRLMVLVLLAASCDKASDEAAPPAPTPVATAEDPAQPPGPTIPSPSPVPSPPAPVPSPPTPVPPPPSPIPAPPPITPKKINVKETVQPEKRLEKDPSIYDGDPEDGEESGVEGGIEGGDLGGVVGGTASDAPPPPPPPPPPPAGPQIVPAATLDAQRLTTSAKAIEPDAADQAKIAADGLSRVTAVFKMCVGKDGGVASVKLLKSSGYPGWDARLTEGMKRWKYRPYLVNGTPTAVCAAQTFVYQPSK